MNSTFFKYFVFSFIFIFFNLSLSAQGLSSSQIDSLVQKTMTTFDVPGMAVAVIKDGEIYHKKT